MKHSIKVLSTLAILAGALTSCGQSTASSAAPASTSSVTPAASSVVSSVAESSVTPAPQTAKFTATYDISQYSLIESMGWYIVDDYQLYTYSDSTYLLVYTEDMFGAIDDGFETKGHRVLITEGTYTTKDSEDGVDGHLDISLSASPIVFGYQHHKGYSRNTDIVGQTAFIDTSNWTTAMTDATSAAYPNGASDILAKYGSAKTVTAEDPASFTDDTTLAYQLVTVPADDANGVAAPELAKFKTMKAGYDISSYSLIEAMGWYTYNNDFVLTFSDNTYLRNNHSEMFGAIDSGYEVKGVRNVITEGTYTLKDSSTDGIDGHGDLTISASDRVYLNQHHKGYTRNSDVNGVPLICDTDNWTDAMTSAVAGTYTDMAGFKAAFGGEKTAIASDPTLFTEDTTLSYQLITDFE